ncbi:hypothetical protein DL237_07060 [Pseudooceanicola sediminis]|uniref:Uncharacterized protein n=1 Tax=Pseudooceanicola sediminis TaxID=2211117 RepID=A0A399J9R4_9RHOB|nr:hypothetical protein [Pseudooceanicola sediminis]KAA2314648.1 hypothetical protein E0K93_10075 [Puniceibacterium sp. HSS470]RII39396.1 hypothetical protein DL237_07060 [Pseudooceanicola sediminis]
MARKLAHGPARHPARQIPPGQAGLMTLVRSLAITLVLSLVSTALLAPSPARSGPAATTLLRPKAISYAADGGYALSFNRNWGSLSFDIFTPRRVILGNDGLGEVSFDHVALAFSGNDSAHSAQLSYGRVWRTSLSANRVLGINGYLDFGKRAAIDEVMAQATVGLEYEIALQGVETATNLTFGSNLYLTLDDYTRARYSSSAWVPRRGVDSYVAWSQTVGSGLQMGARASLFQYPATATRQARGIGTLSLTSRVTRGLPQGTSLSAALTGRFTPGEVIAPRLKLQLRRSRPVIHAQGTRPVGTLQPSRKCSIRPAATRLDRLDCGRRAYHPRRMHEYYRPKGTRTEGTVSVPTPRRRLGYGSLYVP